MPRALGLMLPVPVPYPASLRFGETLKVPATCHVDAYGVVSDVQLYTVVEGELRRAQTLEGAVRSNAVAYASCLNAAALLVQNGEGELVEEEDPEPVPEPQPTHARTPAPEPAPAEG